MEGIKGDERNFSFYSPLHKTYSRIDYIFVSKDLLTRVNNTNIDIIQISDHAKVNMGFAIENDYRKAKRWKIDEKIYSHKQTIEKIYKKLEDTWKINENGGGQTETIWGAMKVVVRGCAWKEACVHKKLQK